MRYAIITITLISLLLSTTASGQKDSTLSEKIVNDFCKEFNKKNFDQPDDWKVELGLIIMPIIAKYSNEIKKEWGFAADNMSDYEKIAEKIGSEAAAGCPAFLQFVKNNLDEIMGEDEELRKSLSGKLLRTEDEQFSCLVIKTKNGKEEKLWWFEFFEGSDHIVNEKKTLVGKSVTAEYKEIEVYNPQLRDYFRIKVIKKLSLD